MSREDLFKKLIEQKLFNHIGTHQKHTLNAIMDEAKRIGYIDPRWLAYMLATAYHHTAHTMQPKKELDGFIKIADGDVLKRLDSLLAVPLLKNREMASRPDIALRILFVGMIRGAFTGKKLHEYLNQTTEDWKGARQVIGDMESAAVIAEHAQKFYQALK